MPTIRDELTKMCQQEYARGHARSDGEMRLERVLRRLADPSPEMIEAMALTIWGKQFEGMTGPVADVFLDNMRTAFAAALRAV